MASGLLLSTAEIKSMTNWPIPMIEDYISISARLTDLENQDKTKPSGTFTTTDGKTITVVNGKVTSIV